MRADALARARAVAEKLALGAALASIGYAAFALARVRAFERTLREPPRPSRRPPITVLKPVRGLEPQLEENLRSFCAQDYPDYHVVLGVRRASDPALPLLRRLAAEFPDRTDVVAGDDAASGEPGATTLRNPKIANLAPMLARARGEILVIADSDMRVEPHYLDAVAEAFDDPAIGAATAIYRGEPDDRGLASALGAMWITEQFAPSALVSAALEPLAHTFGATMAVRREVLDEIGGLAALGDRLADDHALGRLVAERGHRVALARCVVTNVVSESGLVALVRHELRWARTIRTVRRGGYLGIVLTYPLPLAVLHLALARRRVRALPLVAVAAALRLALGVAARRTFNGRPPAARTPCAQMAVSAALAPLRDVLGIAVWALGLGGGNVRWREDALSVDPRGGIR
ncbi:MAG TPA: bacteriohopanetetrol glucosamine biosynthesis glycosyltransferase HpnI [Candidatus Elarobacter sp.]|jgi:ceramide glucosyltransferase|nr:bacteriohopanetetrol glucosamine biosynthesis glycosyltransferase HpnI [Candidatus Elarobacter sp.]